MSDRLPPLTALRAFEAAARHMSFAKAAEELNVTPAALSFQIKSLEELLGAPVFRRLNRAVELTEAGKMLAPGTTDAFTTLGAAWSQARRNTQGNAITVTSGPGITALWLAPRLFSFASDHPEIDLRFSANLKLIDLARDDVDVAIRYGHGDDEGLHRRTLQHEYVTPMMTPDVARSIKSPEDLFGFPLLRDDLTQQISPHATWEVWFRAQGLVPPANMGPRFNQADHAISAAAAGIGILLGRVCLATGELSQGRLVAPFDTAIETCGTYRALCVDGMETRPAIAAFLDWIATETKDFDRPVDGCRIVTREEAEALVDG